jgi:solute carrier family 25 carnitine/acylcarnitine transporter 20/29
MSRKEAVTIKDFISGSIAGMVSVVLGQPLETVKVRMQSQQAMYKSSIDCIRKMYSKEGFMSFYKGTLSPLLGISFCFGACFSANSFSKNLLKKRNREKGKSDALTRRQFFYCGLFTGFCTSFLNCPIEYIRIIMQVQGAKMDKKIARSRKFYTGSADCFVKIYRSQGKKALFTGLIPTILRDVPGSGIYFGTLENMMIKGEKKYGSRSKIPSSLIMLCGSIAGLISAVFIFPMDVVKSIIQANTEKNEKYKNVLSTIQTVNKEIGYRGFFYGLTPCIARSLPISAIVYLTFEKSSNYLKSHM